MSYLILVITLLTVLISGYIALRKEGESRYQLLIIPLVCNAFIMNLLLFTVKSNTELVILFLFAIIFIVTLSILYNNNKIDKTFINDSLKVLKNTLVDAILVIIPFVMLVANFGDASPYLVGFLSIIFSAILIVINRRMKYVNVLYVVEFMIFLIIVFSFSLSFTTSKHIHDDTTLELNHIFDRDINLKTVGNLEFETSPNTSYRNIITSLKQFDEDFYFVVKGEFNDEKVYKYDTDTGETVLLYDPSVNGISWVYDFYIYKGELYVANRGRIYHVDQIEYADVIYNNDSDYQYGAFYEENGMLMYESNILKLQISDTNEITELEASNLPNNLNISYYHDLYIYGSYGGNLYNKNMQEVGLKNYYYSIRRSLYDLEINDTNVHITDMYSTSSRWYENMRGVNYWDPLVFITVEGKNSLISASGINGLYRFDKKLYVTTTEMEFNFSKASRIHGDSVTGIYEVTLGNTTFASESFIHVSNYVLFILFVVFVGKVNISPKKKAYKSEVTPIFKEEERE